METYKKFSIKLPSEINGIRYRIATFEDHVKIIDFYFDIFLKDEPATKSRGGYVIRPIGIINLIKEILYQNATVISEDTETNELVGINTNYIFYRSVHIILPQGRIKTFFLT